MLLDFVSIKNCSFIGGGVEEEVVVSVRQQIGLISVLFNVRVNTPVIEDFNYMFIYYLITYYLNLLESF